ncbi:MAG: proline--tRNA ligase [Micavibrio aeruginosavorus]|uniref:Proline--tRNA ligase n=1 Tax=Micavibrio aeruginosavorus TaxID=349221 RepID=A0A2W5FN09_9BACT|nr:MAG: proline--tRNA ligase [Micavibrio aeruginosavorus]
MNQPNQAQKAHGKNSKSAISPTREENFPEWYQEVVKVADLAENSPTRGSMIIKPNGYALWENIQRALDDLIKAEGVQNAYFPLLIPLSFIAKEAEHIDGFAKECAVVTHHRLEAGPDGKLIPAPDAKLEETFVIRPTSETIIGDAMARWTQSYRDLPLLLNQWANVMRWEMRTRLFLRTSEFLWQEGHNAFETAEEGNRDARKMLEVYNDLYENWFAIPGFKGEKTPEEKFPGAVNTYTIEGMMQDGKALQMCTSHDLGQTFSKSCNIKFQGRDGKEQLAWTTSWGLTTRSIGAMIMSHGDDDGLIMPPKLAPTQVMILPIIKDESGAGPVLEYAQTLAKRLKEIGVRAKVDTSDARAPDKMWDAIKKGVPVRVEIGAREVEQNALTFVRRDIGRDSKESCSPDEFVARIQDVLSQSHNYLYKRAYDFTRSKVKETKTIAEIQEFFKSEIGFAKAPISVLTDGAYEAVRKEYSLSSRCLPFEDEGQTVLIGKSY